METQIFDWTERIWQANRLFIANNNYKQQDWKLGCIKDGLILSRDDTAGAVFVDAITSGKINTIKHSINKLFPIETVKEIDSEKFTFVV